MSALFDMALKPPEMKKADPLSYEGTGTIGTIFPPKGGGTD